jgi:hypothetical protein
MPAQRWGRLIVVLLAGLLFLWGDVALQTELDRLRTSDTVDARGVVISDGLLQELLDAVPRRDHGPVFTVARFERATLERHRVR